MCCWIFQVFDKLGQSYSTVDITEHPNGSEVQDALKEMTGASTVWDFYNNYTLKWFAEKLFVLVAGIF